MSPDDCLFCASNGPFTTVEHIIPESLGNDELLLEKEICDGCQNYFGKEIEKYVLAKSPLAFWRTFLGIRTKDRKYPSVSVAQPKRERGVFPSTHPHHDDIGYTFHDDGTVSVDIDDPQIVQDIIEGKRSRFHVVFTPKLLFMFGRFLCKVGTELLCTVSPSEARSDRYLSARRYARFGQLPRLEGFGEGKPSRELWPLLHYSTGNPSDFRRVSTEPGVEKVDCYSYSLLEFKSEYTLLDFSMGTDHWVVSLSQPFPHPVVKEAIPGTEMSLIWYGSNQWQKTSS